jgi:glycosyltransferase involved in cell wall biosynthesis
MTIGHINLAKGFRGGERQTVLLVNELSRYCRQKLFIRRGSPMIKIVNDNVEVVELDKPFTLSIHKLKSCDCLHAHEAKASQLALITNLIYQTPYFITRRVLFSPKKNLFNELMYHRASRVFTLSKAIDRTLCQKFKRAKTSIIPSALTPLKTTKQRELLKERFKNKFIILHIGALVDSDKGQNIILDIAKNLETTYPDIHFILVGDGPDRTMFEKRIKKLTNVTLEGFKENVGDYLSIANIFVFPSHNEGLGSILLDAMNFNLPIIASDVGGIPDIVKDGYTGYLFKDGDTDALNKKIIELYESKSKRDFFIQNSRKTLEHYKIEHLAKLYLPHYNSIKACD